MTPLATRPDGPSTPTQDPDPMPRLIVTIDGPAGTGKSTVARELAGRLGLEFLDTGAMYRAATALAIDHDVALDDAAAIAELTRRAELRFDWTAPVPELRAFGASIMHRLRSAEVDQAVSPVAQLPEVREVLVGAQRRIGREHPRLVSEGRDQGSVVFPDADVKIYLDADARVRATRRAAQLGHTDDPAMIESIERELVERDDRDSSRAVGPLVCPPDAVRVDTSSLSEPEVIDRLHEIVVERVPEGVRNAGPGDP